MFGRPLPLKIVNTLPAPSRRPAIGWQGLIIRVPGVAVSPSPEQRAAVVDLKTGSVG
jgi:hypothetical protein